MNILHKDKIIETIKNEYPNSDNKYLAKKLGISETALRTKASRLGIKKSSEYMMKIYNKMHQQRKIKQENSYYENKYRNMNIKIANKTLTMQ